MLLRLPRAFTDWRKRLTTISRVAVIALLSAIAPAAGAATGGAERSHYAVTILSTLSPDPNLSSLSNADGINDRGLIVGDANYPGTWRAGDTSYGPKPNHRPRHAWWTE